jgi:preprotein translocase subunit SecE
MAQELKKEVQKNTNDSKLQKSNTKTGEKKDIFKFFKEVKGELKKVIWPDRKQLTNNTLTVLISCCIVGVLIWIADIGLKFLYDNVFK